MANSAHKYLALLVACNLLAPSLVRGGIIKDLYQKVTNTNNKTEDTVKQSAPVCGSGLFSTPNEGALTPEIIFITSRPSRTLSQHGGGSSGRDNYSNSNRERRVNHQVNEIANEFRFHPENVSLRELERHGFNREAPSSFLMHGFTSGYPLQAWISAIVEAYTIDRETNSNSHDLSSSNGHQNYGSHGDSNNDHNQSEREYRRDAEGRSRRKQSNNTNNNNDGRHREDSSSLLSASYGSGGHQPSGGSSGSHQSNVNGSNRPVEHNLFIINWNYAARGILYPRAVANIPIVASYVTRFINEKLLDEAGVEPRRIQLIGHSLGAHLAGFIGKNTRSKLGRIYGLDPAGPCFGSLSGSLYPSSKRLAPSDAHEVITVQTNSALLGIDKPLGRYSVYVEGGLSQPGCPASGVLKSIGTLTWDGGDFDTVACSHSRAPNLLTYRHDQSDDDDDCQMVAYACKDWDSFKKGFCGVCDGSSSGSGSDFNLGYNEDGRSSNRRAAKSSDGSPLEPRECHRIGLDWQYPGQSSHHQSSGSADNQDGWSSSSNHGGDSDYSLPDTGNSHRRTTRRPQHGSDYGASDPNEHSNSRRPIYNGPNSERLRRALSKGNSTISPQGRDYGNSSSSTNSRDVPATEERRLFFSSQDKEDGSVQPIEMFLRTGDTQPYCSFHYQVVLELDEPFEGRRPPPMSIILQDSEHDEQRSRRPSTSTRRFGVQNSLSNDAFGNKFDERTYTHLLTSNKKLQRIDHATMIFREGLRDGHRRLKALYVNYMSHSDQAIRRRLSTRLCPIKTDTDRAGLTGDGGNRFYFKPCEQSSSSSSHGREHSTHSQSGREGHLSSSQNGSNSNNDQHYRERKPHNSQPSDHQISHANGSQNQEGYRHRDSEYLG